MFFGFMLKIASEQYRREAYQQQKSFRNGIYAQTVNIVWAGRRKIEQKVL